MKELKERILTEGKFLPGGVLKVDSFLNHKIDVGLADRIGEEFAKRFSSEDCNKVLTVESSGIAVAYAAARAMGNLPLVFAKKAPPNTMVSGFFGTDVRSFTKESVCTIRISKEFLSPGDKVLIIDDFLAYGEAALGLIKLVSMSGGEVCGIGVVIEKKFQGGGDKLRAAGYRVESLAAIESISEGRLKFHTVNEN